MRELTQGEMETLLHNVQEAVDVIRRMTDGDISQRLGRLMPNTSLEERAHIRRLEMDIGHDRGYCSIIGVGDYNRLPPKDMNRITYFAYLLAKRDPDITLPLAYFLTQQ